MATVKIQFSGSKADVMTLFSQIRNTITRPVVAYSMRDVEGETIADLEIEMPERIRRAMPRFDPLRMAGVVKVWVADGDNPYGFIKVDDGPDVYLPASEVLGGNLSAIRPGITVSFRRVRGAGGEMAVQVCNLHDEASKDALIDLQMNKAR